MVELESSEVSQHLDGLALIHEALDEEIAKNNKLLTTTQGKVSSTVQLVAQQEGSITLYNRKIYQIVASTGVSEVISFFMCVCFIDVNSALLIQLIYLFIHSTKTSVPCKSR